MWTLTIHHKNGKVDIEKFGTYRDLALFLSTFDAQHRHIVHLSITAPSK
jgi:hypothetical protein